MIGAVQCLPYWQCFMEGQHELEAANVDRVLIKPNRDAVLRIQFARSSQLLGTDQLVRVPKGQSVHFFCNQKIELYCIPIVIEPTTIEQTKVPADQVEIALIADSILAHSAEIYMLNLRFGDSDELRQAWEQLVCARARYLANQQSTPAMPDSLVSKLNRFIDAKLAHPVTADDMAQHLELSKTQLLRWIKSQLNCTPCQYLIQRRLQRAKELLAQTQHSLVDIALQTGFASQAHFANTFKQSASHTPGAYRRMHQAKLLQAA
jgi:AraC-like DNA-binding protein